MYTFAAMFASDVVVVNCNCVIYPNRQNHEILSIEKNLSISNTDDNKTSAIN